MLRYRDYVPFNRQGNPGTEGLTNMAKVTLPVSSKPEFWTVTVHILHDSRLSMLFGGSRAQAVATAMVVRGDQQINPGQRSRAGGSGEPATLWTIPGESGNYPQRGSDKRQKLPAVPQDGAWTNVKVDWPLNVDLVLAQCFTLTAFTIRMFFLIPDL